MSTQYIATRCVRGYAEGDGMGCEKSTKFASPDIQLKGRRVHKGADVLQKTQTIKIKAYRVLNGTKKSHKTNVVNETEKDGWIKLFKKDKKENVKSIYKRQRIKGEGYVRGERELG